MNSPQALWRLWQGWMLVRRLPNRGRRARHKRCRFFCGGFGSGLLDNWGKRKLAYEINGLTDGDYTLIDFHAEPSNIAELDRVLRISDVVVRHMIVARTDRD